MSKRPVLAAELVLVTLTSDFAELRMFVQVDVLKRLGRSRRAA